MSSDRPRRRLPLGPRNSALLGLFAAGMLVGGGSSAEAQSQIFQPGDLAVTGLSGRLALTADPARLDPDGFAAQVFRLRLGNATPKGSLGDHPVVQITAGDIGQVFGAAFDGAPVHNLYLTPTSAYGLHLVGADADGDGRPDVATTGAPGVDWMSGQWGAGIGGDAGSIYRVDGTDGTISIFAEIPGVGPASLGSIAYEPASKAFFVSDLDNGLIYRIDAKGNVLDSFDHGQVALPATGAAAILDDGSSPRATDPVLDTTQPTTWGFTPDGRRVDALAVQNRRLYYAVAQGPEVWSVGIAATGDFAGDPRREAGPELFADVAGPITSLAFDPQGRLYAATRPTSTGDASLDQLITMGGSVVRLTPDAATGWSPIIEHFAIGTGSDGSGGLAIGQSASGACDLVVASGDHLDGGASGLAAFHRDNPAQASWTLPIVLPSPAGMGHVGGVAVWQDCGTPLKGSAPVTGTGAKGASATGPASIGSGGTGGAGSDGGGTGGGGTGGKGPAGTTGGGSAPFSITKVGLGPCVAVSAKAQDCNYLVTVTNNGPNSYTGVLQVNDESSFKHAKLEADGAWTCPDQDSNSIHCTTAGKITLAVGQSMAMKVQLEIAHGDLSGAPCQVPNVATLATPAGAKPATTLAALDTLAAATGCIVKPPGGTGGLGGGPEGDLEITKTPGACVPVPPTTVHVCAYTVTVTNKGSADLTGIAVEDKTTYPGGVVGADANWTCDTGKPDPVCTLNAGNVLKAGGTFTMHPTVVVVTPSGCDVPNRATLINPAGPTTPDAIDTLPSSSGCTAVPPSGKANDLAITKTAAPCTVGPTVVCDYQIVVTNVGTGQFHNKMRIVEKPEASATTLGSVPKFSVSVNVGTGWTCTPPSGPLAGLCTNPDLVLPSGKNQVFTVRTEYPLAMYEAHNCRLSNQAYFDHSFMPSDDNASNDSASDTEALGSADCTPKGPVAPASGTHDLSVTKTLSGACATGTLVACDFDVVVKNEGTAMVTGSVSLREIPDSFGLYKNGDLNLIAVSAPGWTCDPNTVSGGVLPHCSDGALSLAPGATATFTAHATLDPAQLAGNNCSFKNTAELDGWTDDSAANNSNTVTVTLDPAKCTPATPAPPAKTSHLSLKKIGGNACTLVSGSGSGTHDCTFVIDIYNAGPDDYSDPLVVKDHLTATTAFSTLISTDPNWDCTGDGTSALECTWKGSVLKAGPAPATTLTVHVTIPAQDANATACNVQNMASLKTPAGPEVAASVPDTLPSITNCLDDADAAIPNQPRLELTKAGVGTCTSFGTDVSCSYLVTIANTGTADYAGPIVLLDHPDALGAKLTTYPLTSGYDVGCLSAGGGVPSCLTLAVTASGGTPAVIAAGASIAFSIGETMPLASVANACATGNHIKLTSPSGAWAVGLAQLETGICPSNAAPHLKVSKSLDSCAAAADGYDCNFTIKVENNGSGDYVGDVALFDDVDPSGTVAMTGCLTAFPLAGAGEALCAVAPIKAGDATTLHSRAHLAPTDLAFLYNCNIGNGVTIWPENPADPDGFSEALARLPLSAADAANYPNAHCDVPPSQTMDNKIAVGTIDKTAVSCVPTLGGKAAECTYAVAITMPKGKRPTGFGDDPGPNMSLNYNKTKGDFDCNFGLSQLVLCSFKSKLFPQAVVPARTYHETMVFDIPDPSKFAPTCKVPNTATILGAVIAPSDTDSALLPASLCKPVVSKAKIVPKVTTTVPKATTKVPKTTPPVSKPKRAPEVVRCANGEPRPATGRCPAATQKNAPDIDLNNIFQNMPPMQAPRGGPTTVPPKGNDSTPSGAGNTLHLHGLGMQRCSDGSLRRVCPIPNNGLH